MLVQFSLLFDLSLFNVFLVALKTLFLTFDVQYPSPQGVCELVEEIKQVLINYDNGQHVVEGVQRDGRRGGKKDIEWFALDMNKDHSVIFEIASKYCILDSCLL